MPHFKYKKTEYGMPEMAKSAAKEYPCVFIPMGPKQVDGLEIGDKVEVKLKGIVKGLSQRDNKEANLDLYLAESDVYKSEGTEYEEMSESDMEEGT